jgi:hypothetical protein
MTQDGDMEAVALVTTYSASAEKNSRGWTWKVGVQNAPSVLDLFEKLDELSEGMVQRYGAAIEVSSGR